MKKILFFIAFILVSNFIFSQIEYGLSGGINGSTFAKNEWSHFFYLDSLGKFKFDYFAGSYIDIPVSGKLSIVSGIDYFKKGKLAKDGLLKEVYDLHYISVPVLLRVYIFDSFKYDVGITASRVVLRKFYYYLANEFNDISAFINDDSPQSNVKFNKYELGITTGFETTLDFKLNIGFRYCFTPNPTITIDGTAFDLPITKFYNHNFYLYASYPISYLTSKLKNTKTE